MSEDLFGPYRMVALLGRGGMGEVWRAVDTSQGDRVVALKVLGAWLRGDQDFARRFQRESALAAKLNAPNIVPIHRYGEIDGRLFIDMALIDGTDLGALIERGGPLPATRAVGITAQVARALAVAHRSGLVHRDVKPSNILISHNDGEDHVYLIDFGISRAVNGTDISLSGGMIGTPAYMAPERFAGDGDHRSDIYALGCVLHEALTGRQPFHATNPLVFMNAHLHTPPPRPSVMAANVPPALDGVISRALAKAPEHRFATTTDLAVAARHALTQGLPPGHAPIPAPLPAPLRPAPPVRRTPTGPGLPAPLALQAPPPFRPPPKPGRHRLVIALIAAIVPVGVIVGVVMLIVGIVNAPNVEDPARLAETSERTLTGHTDWVYALATTELDGRPVVASGSGDDTVRIWDAATGQPVGQPLTGHDGDVLSVVASRLDGRTVIITGSADRTVRVWDPATGSPVGQPFTGHTDWIRAVATAELGGRPVVISASDDSTVRIWDMATGNPIGQPLTGHTNWVRALTTLQVDGRTVVASGSDDGTVRMWDLETGSAVGSPLEHPDWVRALTTTELDGRTVIVSGCDDKLVRLWDPATQTTIGEPLVGHTDYLRALGTADVDGRPVVVSGSDDDTVRIWDPATARTIGRPFVNHPGDVLAVASTEVDGRTLIVSAGDDSTVRIWDPGTVS